MKLWAYPARGDSLSTEAPVPWQPSGGSRAPLQVLGAVGDPEECHTPVGLGRCDCAPPGFPLRPLTLRVLKLCKANRTLRFSLSPELRHSVWPLPSTRLGPPWPRRLLSLLQPFWRQGAPARVSRPFRGGLNTLQPPSSGPDGRDGAEAVTAWCAPKEASRGGLSVAKSERARTPRAMSVQKPSPPKSVSLPGRPKILARGGCREDGSQGGRAAGGRGKPSARGYLKPALPNSKECTH